VSCTSCPAGSFAGSGGSNSCTPCTAGTFAAYPGQTSCTLCPSGTSSDPGAVACR
jgi:hypothetical protein